MDSLRRELEHIFGKERIFDSDLYRGIYGRDASYFNLIPQAVVRPRTVEEISSLLGLARRRGVSVTFRTGGTSLSGQTVNTGIICELRTDWKRYEIRDNGRKIWFEPGLTAQQVNAFLHPHHTHIGPDPASSCAAMMGGILANNSSGMHAGVKYNSYHTLSSIEFMLADGNRYDSGKVADRKRFEDEEKELCRGLMEIRATIMGNDEMREKIIRKYRIKNVTGYGMNSFVDFDNPMDIFSHLLIGSEGTLAYIVSGELNTLPLFPVYSSVMLYFADVVSAAATAAWLGESGATAVEMMDYASIRSYLGQKLDMPPGTTAMLVDYGAETPEAMEALTTALLPKLKKLKNLTRISDFTHTVSERAELWKMRDGIFPCVAGARVPGATVILEDVVSPVAELDRLVDGIQNLFLKYGYDGAIFGHARDGNVHPLLTTPITGTKSTERFKAFMDGFVDHVLSLEGSLKGEHGTGRAIAPFVAKEWGDDIYALMKKVKLLADPHGILNPGVIINDDPECFIKPMKQLNIFGKQLGYERADMCMECGYCEHVCPSRNITLTPRQRLQARRIIEASGKKFHDLSHDYRFVGLETCCSDGSCQMPCPMGISTAMVTDALRDALYPRPYKQALTASAKRYATVEDFLRGMLRAAVLTEKVISPYPLIWASDLMHKIYSQVPHWTKYFPMPSKLHFLEVESPDFIYFPACVTRIFGASSLGKDDLVTVVLRLAQRAGLKVAVPKKTHGLCCSQIWEHKGDPSGKRIIANATVEAFYEMTEQGHIPLFCDTTSCTHTLLTSLKDALTPESLGKYQRMRIMDITEWLESYVMPKLKVTHPKDRVLLHPTCAARLLKVQDAMEEIARKCAKEVTVPVNCQCCGAAGDRGFIYPEVADSAVAEERKEVEGKDYDGYYSLARTCEISMMSTIGRPYESIAYLVDETTSEKS